MVLRNLIISIYKYGVNVKTYFNLYLEGKYVNENLSVIINDSSQIPWDDVFQPKSRPDCDKWNHWNSLMFSFTAITTIGQK